MRKLTLLHACLGVILILGTTAGAQPGHPLVFMTVEPGGEKPQELSARESGLARIKLKSGVEYAFRPTIQDSKPWTRVVVTIFRMDPTVETLGQVELKTGAAPVASQTKPSFRIAVTKVVEKSDDGSALAWSSGDALVSPTHRLFTASTTRAGQGHALVDLTLW